MQSQGRDEESLAKCQGTASACVGAPRFFQIEPEFECIFCVAIFRYEREEASPHWLFGHGLRISSSLCWDHAAQCVLPSTTQNDRCLQEEALQVPREASL